MYRPIAERDELVRLLADGHCEEYRALLEQVDWWQIHIGDQEYYVPQVFLLTPLGDAVVRVYSKQIEKGGRIRWDVPRLRQEIVERCPER